MSLHNYLMHRGHSLPGRPINHQHQQATKGSNTAAVGAWDRCDAAAVSPEPERTTKKAEGRETELTEEQGVIVMDVTAGAEDVHSAETSKEEGKGLMNETGNEGGSRKGG